MQTQDAQQEEAKESCRYGLTAGGTDSLSLPTYNGAAPSSNSGFNRRTPAPGSGFDCALNIPRAGFQISKNPGRCTFTSLYISCSLQPPRVALHKVQFFSPTILLDQVTSTNTRNTTTEMLCQRCARSFNFQLQRILDAGGVGIIVDHNLARLAEGLAAGCNVCSMILLNLSTSGFSTEGLPLDLGDSMFVKIWHDTSVEFFTGDQQDQVRFDVVCAGKVANLEVMVLEDEQLETKLLDIGDNPQPDDDTSSENAFTMVKHWMSNCLTYHADCIAACNSSTSGTSLPTRVIDVGPPDGSQEPRLHTTNGASGTYAALSHCWGQHPLLQTTSKTLAGHLYHIPMASLPKTFQDAVSICRKLYLRYLWIDSLCIIQDNDADWQREARLMGSVYKNADITIAAMSAKDSSIGCFSSRNAQKIRPCWNGMLHGSVPVFLRPRRDVVSQTFAQLRPTLEAGALVTRGWTLQEQILSRRVLWYHDNTLYWSCPTNEACEQVPEGISGDQFKGMNYWLVVQQAIHGIVDLSQPQVVNSIYAAWYRLTMEFSGRQLTFDKDRVYALAGLANEMEKALAKYAAIQAIEADSFVAGLWKRELWRGLLWTMVDANYTNEGAKRSHPLLAPSWSWVSTTGFITYLTYGSRVKDLEGPDPVEPIDWEWEIHSTTLDISPMPTDTREFDPLTDGKLTIKGPLKDALPCERADLTDPQTGEKWGVWLRDEEGWMPKIIKCLAIASQVYGRADGDVRHTWCLLLQKVEGTEATYRRVGAARVEKGRWLSDAVVGEVCII
ncbi:hypothetical protein G7046_g8504 [Stylonectria norvegica]|nr:hypothetical protein G7046_g8504 [Stylonectria norvegica]